MKQSSFGALTDILQAGGGAVVNLLKDAGLNVLTKGGMKIRLRSNVTPELAFDLGQLISQKEPSQQTPTAPAISSGSPMILKFIRPKIALKGLGMSLDSAPYGEPNKYGWVILLSSVALSILLGIKLAWMFCSWIPPKELVQLQKLSKAQEAKKALGLKRIRHKRKK